MSDIMSRLNQLEEIMRVLTAKVGDVDQQQQALSIVLVRLEQDWSDPDGSKPTPPAREAANGGAIDEHTGDGHSVAPLPGAETRGPEPPHRRHYTQEDDQDDVDFLPTYHKLDFPKFDRSCETLPWLNRCEHYFCVRRTPDHKRISYA
jgi:hypothetical protein